MLTPHTRANSNQRPRPKPALRPIASEVAAKRATGGGRVLVDVSVGQARILTDGDRTYGSAAQRRRAGSAIEVKQPTAPEAAREIDVLSETCALHAPAGENGSPVSLAIHR